MKLYALRNDSGMYLLGGARLLYSWRNESWFSKGSNDLKHDEFFLWVGCNKSKCLIEDVSRSDIFGDEFIAEFSEVFQPEFHPIEVNLVIQ